MSESDQRGGSNLGTTDIESTSGKMVDWESIGPRYEPKQWCCVVFLSKALYPVKNQKAGHDHNRLTWTLNNNSNEQTNEQDNGIYPYKKTGL